ncbi:phage terminase small subunit [Nocardia beijingensis]
MAASKPASLRARRNKTSTRATLRAVDNPEIPDLPNHLAWHRAVLDWWEDCWSSPMAPEWTESDRHTLFLAARLMQQVWDDDTSPASRVTSATEARHLLRECGLTPMARRSLQWEIEKVSEAQDRGADRRAARQNRRAASALDPRSSFKAV